VSINKLINFSVIFFANICLFGSRFAMADAGAELAYLRFTQGYWQVWVTDKKGVAHRQITFDKVDKTKTSWSPDRSRLLANTNEGNLWIIDVKTLEKKSVSVNAVAVFDAQWSPDGKQIAYTSTTSLQADNAEVWVARIEGDETIKVTQNTAVALSPAWNPKNNSILFSAGAPGKNQELWEVHPLSGKSEQITVSKYSSLDPSANREGKILYSCNQSGHYTIWLLDEKQNRKQITTTQGYDGQPSWSPSGASFAFFRISHHTGYCIK
jgi:TolB protein